MAARHPIDVLERRFREAHAVVPADDRVVTWHTPLAHVAIGLCVAVIGSVIDDEIGLDVDVFAMVPTLAGYLAIIGMTATPGWRQRKLVPYRWAAVAGVVV